MNKSAKVNNNLGMHFISGLESYTLQENEKSFLAKIKPIGLIFFARNFDTLSGSASDWRSTFKKLIADAKEASEGSIRILSVDYEGGRVHRFPSEVKQFPYANEWCDKSSKVASEMADILSGLSINMSYGPVLDLDLESSNPVIGPRAFSSDPEIVIRAAKEFYDSFNEKGLLTCGKHFPGHGRTSVDSHFELPVVDISREELEMDLAPFKSLIEEGIPCIMSAHVVYPQIDPLIPASLSHRILTGLLREELGFDGIIFTDDLDMKALSHYSNSEKSKIALEAGSDILLVGNGMDGKALETCDQIMSELNKEIISNSDFQESLQRSRNRIDVVLAKNGI